ncbi:MAG TPA: hypothetical protein VKG65_01905 [Terriglobales bacterium]|nr:hypothetical protein [Terriglobales bacterium]
MRKLVTRTFNLSILTVGLLLGGLPLSAQGNFARGNSSPKPVVRHAVFFGVSAPLRELAALPVRHPYAFRRNNHGFRYDNRLRQGPRREGPGRATGSAVDIAEQLTADAPSNFTIGFNLAGIGMGFALFTSDSNFPDANIAVGDTEIVQVVNSSFAVFDSSTGNTRFPAIPFNVLWQIMGVGGDCSTNDSGHLIVQYDKAAQRWLIAENVLDGYSGPYSACIAISTSDEALGPYYLYEFQFNNGGYPDLQKWAVWTNSYFQSQDNFGPSGNAYVGAEPCAYDRAKMLAGDPSAEQVCFQLSDQDFALLPGDIDSPDLPPAGQDEFFFSLWDSLHLALYSIHIDWSNPSGATITGNKGSKLFPIPSYAGACNGQYLGYCVAQKGASNQLEVLGDRLLYRLVYYNDSSTLPSPSQHWLAVHDVQTNNPGAPQAERWYEFTAPQKKSTVSDITLFQSGTYAPDSNSRWMGSIARDSIGDIMMGYSESSSTMYPAIAITGRLVSDPLGQMEAEQIVFTGSAPQTDPANRWGNYTSMRLDPDGCTLWYTSEYYLTPMYLDWSTQISSATFAGCQ